MEVDDSDDEMEDGEDEGSHHQDVDMTEEGLEQFLKDKSRTCKVLDGEHAVQCMKFVKIFKSNGTWHTEESSSIMRCDAEKVATWKEAIKCINVDVIESQSETLQED